MEKLGPRTLQTLALVAEVVHGRPSRFSDPARFSFALGGKDGHPFPVPLKTYDESIDVLRRSLDAARLGDTEKLEGFARLNASRAPWKSAAARRPISTAPSPGSVRFRGPSMAERRPIAVSLPRRCPCSEVVSKRIAGQIETDLKNRRLSCSSAARQFLKMSVESLSE